MNLHRTPWLNLCQQLLLGSLTWTSCRMDGSYRSPSMAEGISGSPKLCRESGLGPARLSMPPSAPHAVLDWALDGRPFLPWSDITQVNNWSARKNIYFKEQVSREEQSQMASSILASSLSNWTRGRSLAATGSPSGWIIDLSTLKQPKWTNRSFPTSPWLYWSAHRRSQHVEGMNQYFPSILHKSFLLSTKLCWCKSCVTK